MRIIGKFNINMNETYRSLGGVWDRNGRHWELSIDKLDTLVSQLLREKTAHSVHSLDGRPSYK
jgi:hypothetical protein